MELMWNHHFGILQLFHPKFCMEKDIRFEHENGILILPQFTFNETQEYMNLFHDSPRYECCGWVKTIDMLSGYGLVELVSIA
jgi:hypothetical protein